MITYITHLASHRRMLPKILLPQTYYYETWYLLSDMFTAHQIQSEDPRLSTDSLLSPFFRSRVGPRKAQWPKVQDPLKLFERYWGKHTAAIDKARKYLASALENPMRNIEW